MLSFVTVIQEELHDQDEAPTRQTRRSGRNKHVEEEVPEEEEEASDYIIIRALSYVD
jgi:hypothetical protein